MASQLASAGCGGCRGASVHGRARVTLDIGRIEIDKKPGALLQRVSGNFQPPVQGLRKEIEDSADLVVDHRLCDRFSTAY